MPPIAKKGAVNLKNNKLGNFTKLLLVISLIFTAFLLMFTVYVVTDINVIFPIVLFSILTVFSIWVDILYLNCYNWLKTRTASNPKKMRRLKVQNMILSILTFATAFSMWSVLIFTTILYQIFIEFQLYFLGVAVITTVYTINGILIDKAFSRANTI